jgi:hypothetical protein
MTRCQMYSACLYIAILLLFTVCMWPTVQSVSRNTLLDRAISQVCVQCLGLQGLTGKQDEWLHLASCLGISLAPHVLQSAFKMLDSTGNFPLFPLELAARYSHPLAGSGMVLCEEIVHWLMACGRLPGTDNSGNAFAISIQRLNSTASDSPRASSASPRPQTASRNSAGATIIPHQRTHGGAEWKMLKQLSHELGKNLGEEGNRSSPLSPSDLAGLCSFSDLSALLYYNCCAKWHLMLSQAPHLSASLRVLFFAASSRAARNQAKSMPVAAASDLQKFQRNRRHLHLRSLRLSESNSEAALAAASTCGYKSTKKIKETNQVGMSHLQHRRQHRSRDRPSELAIKTWRLQLR